MYILLHGINLTIIHSNARYGEANGQRLLEQEGGKGRRLLVVQPED